MIENLNHLKAYTSSEISDALDACGVEGALLNIKCVSSAGAKLVGPAYTIQYTANKTPSNSFKNAANYIDAIPEHSIIVIDNQGRNDCTVWGDILTQVALRNGVAGTIVHGAVRDVQSIRALNYPLYSSSIYIRSGKNRIHKSNEQTQLVINHVKINPHDIIFADEDGVLVIPRALLDEVLEKAKAIHATENQIKSAISRGLSLENARATYGYDKPWLNPVSSKNE